jgi:large subunit ribosomal protein L25
MAKTETTRLEIAAREPGSSRDTRRLRREGRVPGVLYGRGESPRSFSADARELRHALAGAGAVLEVALDGQTTPAVVKDSHRHPVRGDVLHIDLLRVDLNKPIQAVVTVELIGADEAPGVSEGGVLEHVTREVNVEALPGDIPETIQFDVSGMAMNDTVMLSALTAPSGVTILDEGDEITLATITPPRVSGEEGTGDDEVETETEVVGEGGGTEDLSESADDAPAEAGESGGE